MKRAGSQRISLITILISLITAATLQPAAANLFTSLENSCTGYDLSPTLKALQPISIPGPTSITAMRIKLVLAQHAPRLDVRIYADDASTPSNTLLGTLTWSSTSNSVGRYTGSVTLNSAGKYWIYLSASDQVYMCFTYSAVTTGSLSNWTLSRVFEGAISATPTSRSDNGAFLFTIEGTGGVVQTNSTISLANLPSMVTYRSSSALTATLGVAGSDGKVTFFANGKRIPNCINKSSSALSVSCNWRPSVRGSVVITARLLPINIGFTSAISPVKQVVVSNRVGLR